MEVHTQLGLGFLEKVYEEALGHELRLRGLSCATQTQIHVSYKGMEVGYYVADLLVEDKVLCEIKSGESLARKHEAQLLNYLKATHVKVGLLLNFGRQRLQIKRRVF